MSLLLLLFRIFFNLTLQNSISDSHIHGKHCSSSQAKDYFLKHLVHIKYFQLSHFKLNVASINFYFP